MGRILYIDIAKAICIILVVIGHYFPDNSPQWYETMRRFIYSFHMPLFLFASGYVYGINKQITYGDFIIKKIRRLMVPYFTCSVIVITFKLLSQGNAYIENPVTPLSYLKMFYLPEAGYFLWFIWALFLMYLIIPLFKTRTSHNWLFLGSLIFAYLPFSLPDIFCLSEFKRMFVYFMFGVVIKENSFGKAINQFSWIKMSITTAIFIILEVLFLSAPKGTYPLLEAVLPFVGIAFVIYVSQIISLHINTKRNWLLSVATASYTIYLFHTTFEGIAKAAFLKLPLHDESWYIFPIQAIVVIMAGIIGPLLVYHITKRFSATRYLLGLK